MNCMGTESALVSILLLSYNAQEYIIDMLNSIKEQTYEKLELVVADNGSTDYTSTYIADWLKKNRKRFKRVVFHKNQKNIALTKNINIGLSLCQGKYIKFAYADDILLPSCIEKNYNLCEANNWNVLFSNINILNGASEAKWQNKYNRYYKLSAKEQYKELIIKNFVLAPTFFCRKSLLDKLGGYDEKYRYLDDYPMWLNMTRKGVKLNYFNDVTVLYRVHEGSLTYESEDSQILNKLFFYSDRRLYFRERMLALFKFGCYKEIIFQTLEYVYKSILLLNGNVWNKRNKILRKGYLRICKSLRKYLC